MFQKQIFFVKYSNAFGSFDIQIEASSEDECREVFKMNFCPSSFVTKIETVDDLSKSFVEGMMDEIRKQLVK